MQTSHSRSPNKNPQSSEPNPEVVDHSISKEPSLGNFTLGTRELEEIKLLSQGGYAYIFQVKDTKTDEKFALKKMICQSVQRFKTAKNEIQILQSLPDNAHLVKLLDSKVIKAEGGGNHAYLLLELCEGGSLFDLIVKHQDTKLDEDQIVTIMIEICDGIKALHSCNPPIAHRDIKIENILLHNETFKLCDFGSCSTAVVDFAKIPQSEYVNYEEEYEKNTTLMYRPPEMCDPYQRYTVNNKVDIWMLGCILYTLCFFKHPFQGTSKLSIINAAFKFPQDHSYPEKLVDIIRLMLTPNPEFRPTIFEIVDLFKNYKSLTTIELNPEAKRIKEEAQKHEDEHKNSSNKSGDIPIEELMKLQMKVQQSNKPKNKSEAPAYKNWSDVKYPQLQSNKSVPSTSNDAWGNFGTTEKPSSQSSQQGSFGFDSFDQFSTAPKTNQPNADSSQWNNNFDFASFDAKPTESNTNNNNNAWDATAWGTSQTNPSDKNDQAKKDDKNSFDSFANF